MNMNTVTCTAHSETNLASNEFVASKADMKRLKPLKTHFFVPSVLSPVFLLAACLCVCYFAVGSRSAKDPCISLFLCPLARFKMHRIETTLSSPFARSRFM